MTHTVIVVNGDKPKSLSTNKLKPTKKENKTMFDYMKNNPAVLVVVVLGILTSIFCLAFGLSVISINNDCVEMEAGIVNQYEQDKNNHSNMFKKFKEMAQVPDMYTSDLKSVFNSAIAARSGEDGYKSAILFVKEHNPNFSDGLYAKLMQTIESGRNDFEINQKELLDRKRAYQVYIGKFPNSLIASAMGYPKINLDDMKIITTAATENAFQTGTEEPIKFR